MSTWPVLLAAAPSISKFKKRNHTVTYRWQIEKVTLHDTTDVTIRNIKSEHIPLRLDGSREANSILIQLLRHAGYTEEEYPYQRHHRNRGWGPQVEGLGIVINRRFKNGEVPGHAALYELAADTEIELLRAARQYAPFAQYFASSTSQPDLSVIEADIDELRGEGRDNRARIENLAGRTVRILEEVSNLRGNVGDLIDSHVSNRDVDEIDRNLESSVRKLTTRSETVYDTLYDCNDGLLPRTSAVERSCQHIPALAGRIRSLEESVERLAHALKTQGGISSDLAVTPYGTDAPQRCPANQSAGNQNPHQRGEESDA